MKITVVTACWNGAKTLATALESVRSQVLPTGVSLEHIVVDGGSDDGSAALLEAAAKVTPRLGFAFRGLSERDRGLYDALNKGMKLATGDVIGILNADDVFAADDVIAKVAAAFAADAQLEATYGDIRFVRGGDTVKTLRTAPTVRYCTGRFFRTWMFRFATFPAHPSTFVRRDCFTRFGDYSLDYRICADFELMLRLFWKHRIRAQYLPLCTTVMRLGGLSTGGLKSTLEINREDLRALRANGCWSSLPLLYVRYLFKIWGFARVRAPWLRPI